MPSKYLLHVLIAALLFMACGRGRKSNNMSESQKSLLELKSTDYVSGGYPETMRLAKPICDELIDELVPVADAARFEDKIEIFMKCQRRLNSFMMSDGVRADTVERDIFYNVLEKIGAMVKMNATEEQKTHFIVNVLDSEELLDE